MMNKRGQGLSTNAIILIVLGVIVLVFLIVGFTIGFEKIFPFITPKSNVKDVASNCNIACNSRAEYDFCTAKREVKVEEGIQVNETYTSALEFKGTCNDLSAVVGLGIKECPELGCNPADVNKIKVSKSA